MEEIIGKDFEGGSGTTYLSEIDKIETSDQSPEVKIELLDILIKSYLRKRYHLKRNMEYEEMIEFFMEKSKPNVAAFCHEMILGLYSGEMINMNNVSVLLEDGKTMIEKEESSERTGGIEKKASGFLGRFSRSKKEDKNDISQNNVGKQTKKIIDKYLDSNSKVIEEIKKTSVLDETQKDKSLMYDLNPALVPNQDNLEEIPDIESVSNIDDLERIKKKIRQRKIIVSKDKK